MNLQSSRDRRERFKKELLRKGIHLLIAFTPALAAINRPLTIALLCAGSLFYLGCELLRLKGRAIPLLSRITAFASRPHESGKFVLGPVTLAAGTILALVIFPLLPSFSPVPSMPGNNNAAIHAAIYALAFGDGLSGLVGRPFGRLRPPFLRGKSVEGSAVCCITVFISTWAVTQRVSASLGTALVTTVVEALPLRNMDNIVIPLAAGFSVMLFEAVAQLV
ncbi:MAG: phosphatidate cytidylyltransferase [Spirochaetaceae bacterium]|jgi:dolichol kinase|nr:phosphatidate cytidylyltransferase [Spirochaetaceae bacterium]